MSGSNSKAKSTNSSLSCIYGDAYLRECPSFKTAALTISKLSYKSLDASFKAQPKFWTAIIIISKSFLNISGTQNIDYGLSFIANLTNSRLNFKFMGASSSTKGSY